MDVPLYRGYDHSATLRRASTILFFLLHEGGQPSHRLFHHACAFDDLWQEHLPFTK